MTSASFAAAQQRVLARRTLRKTQTQARLDREDFTTHARLPVPFRGLVGRLRERGEDAWGAIKGREGTRPAFRVGQVDAELLDEELLELLRGEVGEGLKFFGVCAVGVIIERSSLLHSVCNSIENLNQSVLSSRISTVFYFMPL